MTKKKAIENSESTTVQSTSDPFPFLKNRPRPPPPRDENGHLLQHASLEYSHKNARKLRISLQKLDADMWNFSPEEDDVIRKNWDEFRKKYSLSGHIFEYIDYDLEEEGKWEKKPLKPGTFIWPSLCDGLPNRPAKTVRRRIFYIFDKHFKPGYQYNYNEMIRWQTSGESPSFIAETLKIPLPLLIFRSGRVQNFQPLVHSGSKLSRLITEEKSVEDELKTAENERKREKIKGRLKEVQENREKIEEERNRMKEENAKERRKNYEKIDGKEEETRRKNNERTALWKRKQKFLKKLDGEEDEEKRKEIEGELEKIEQRYKDLRIPKKEIYPESEENDPEARKHALKYFNCKLRRLKGRIEKSTNLEKNVKLEEEFQLIKEKKEEILRKRAEEMQLVKVIRKRTDMVEKESEKVFRMFEKDLVEGEKVTQFKNIRSEIQKRIEKKLEADPVEEKVKFEFEQLRIAVKRQKLNKQLEKAENEVEKKEIEEKLAELKGIRDEMFRKRDERRIGPKDVEACIRNLKLKQKELKKELESVENEEDRERIEIQLEEAEMQKIELIEERDRDPEKLERKYETRARERYRYRKVKCDRFPMEHYFRIIRYLYRSSKPAAVRFVPENFDWERFGELCEKGEIECPSMDSVMVTLFEKFSDLQRRFFRFLRPLPNLKERLMIAHEALARYASRKQDEKFRMMQMKKGIVHKPIFRDKLIFTVIYEHYSKNNDNWQPPPQLMKYAEKGEIEKMDTRVEAVKELQKRIHEESVTPMRTLKIRTVPVESGSETTTPRRKSVRLRALRDSLRGEEMEISSIHGDTLLTNMEISAADASTSSFSFRPDETILAGGGRKKRTNSTSPQNILLEERKVIDSFGSLLMPQVDESARKKRKIDEKPAFQPDNTFSNIWDQLNA